MSLVDALQVSPARSRRKKKPGAPSLGLYSPKMSGGVRVEVSLLDGRKLEFSVGARLLTQDLMALVTSHFSLRQTQYFALAHKDTTGHYQWLLDDRRLLDHEFARGVRLLPLHFLVRFFPESVTELRDAQAVELFYQQAKNIITNRNLEIDDISAIRLSALSLQASIGNYIDDSTSKSHLKKSTEYGKRNLCDEKICAEHRQLIGLSRGDAILSYMRQVERIPGYGIHYYEVKDRSNASWYLGINQQGIAQYDIKKKNKPRRLFLWKQLENLYFRERKFSIEVHDPKRVVLALNSYNLYEGAIEDSFHLAEDHLLQAITEDTTQVSVSRRTLGPGNVSVYVWFAETQSLCKSIWSMAIAQHQFYLDRKTSRSKGLQDPPDLVGDLSRSCVSLSTHSSSPNLSRSGSHSSLHHHSHTDSASTESLHAARMEMLAALQQRYDALHEKLEEKSEELKLLCLREGELTGELPLEYPRKPGEPLPVVRKRVGTSFLLDETLVNKIINKQEETVSSLELDYEIQLKIVSAALRLANESSSRKGLRKQRKHSYQQATQRLRDIEDKLRQARNRQSQVLASNANTMPKMKKKPRPVSDTEGLHDYSTHESLKDNCSFADGVALSPQVGDSCPAKYKSSPMTLHSAPPSPQRSVSGNGTSSESSGPSNNKSSRSNSPARPLSGYIQSVVYTRNQYRTQQYPTLSTRGQSVPGDSMQHQRSFNGGLYNLPQQRTSLASHSLDDLDSSNGSSPLINHQTPNLPPHPHHNGISSSQNSKSHYQRRPDSQDRFGSLDRRRVASGNFESRSMEHLDALSPSPIQPPTQGVNSPSYPAHYDLSFSITESPDLQLHLSRHSFRANDSCLDTVDSSLLPREPNGEFTPQDRRLGRNISHAADTSCSSFFGNESMSGELSHCETSSPYTTNQENIPPHQSELLLPLRASNSRSHYKRENYATNLRPTASVNAADHLRAFRVPASDLPPLRPTKSSSELPPLKPTNNRIDSPLYLNRQYETTDFPHAKSSTPIEPRLRGSCNQTPNHHEEPRLLSLAEGARIKKEQKDREWFSGDSKMEGNRRPESGTPSTSQSQHNMSTSSIGSSGSSGSVFHSPIEGDSTMNTSSLNATLTVITTGSYQPSREISKPFEMADFYKYSTKFRRKSSSTHENASTPEPVFSVSLSETPKIRSDPSPPSPSVIAYHSAPGPQQKGVYQPLTPLTCQPVAPQADEHLVSRSNWENTPVHQAVPVNVTNKRAATLV